MAPPVLCLLESTKSVLEGYEKVRLGVSNGRPVIAIPPCRSADRPQYSFPNIRGKSFSFPNGSFSFDFAGDKAGKRIIIDIRDLDAWVEKTKATL